MQHGCAQTAGAFTVFSLPCLVLPLSPFLHLSFPFVCSAMRAEREALERAAAEQARRERRRAAMQRQAQDTPPAPAPAPAPVAAPSPPISSTAAADTGAGEADASRAPAKQQVVQTDDMAGAANPNSAGKGTVPAEPRNHRAPWAVMPHLYVVRDDGSGLCRLRTGQHAGGRGGRGYHGRRCTCAAAGLRPMNDLGEAKREGSRKDWLGGRRTGILALRLPCALLGASAWGLFPPHTTYLPFSHRRFSSQAIACCPAPPSTHSSRAPKPPRRAASTSPCRVPAVSQPPDSPPLCPAAPAPPPAPQPRYRL